MAVENDYRKEFFDDLVSQGVTFAGTKDYAEFEKAMADPVRSKKLYYVAMRKGWELDDYDTWLEDYGPTKGGYHAMPITDQLAMTSASMAQQGKDAAVKAQKPVSSGAAMQSAGKVQQPSVAAGDSTLAQRPSMASDSANAGQDMDGYSPSGDTMMAMTGGMAAGQVARDKEYLKAQNQYGGKEGIAAEEQKRMDAAGVKPSEASTPGFKIDLNTDPVARAHALYGAIKSGTTEEFLTKQRWQMVMSSEMQRNATEKLMSDVRGRRENVKVNGKEISGTIPSQLAYGGLNDDEMYKNMYTSIRDGITDQDMQTFVQDAFGYNYSLMDDAQKKMFKDIADGAVVNEVYAQAIANGMNMSGFGTFRRTVGSSMMIGSLTNAVTNWFGSDEDRLAMQASMASLGTAQEYQNNEHWYGGWINGGAKGVAMAVDMMMLGKVLRYGTGWLNNPVALNTAKYATYGTADTTAGMIMSNALKSPCVVGAINGSAALARGYIEFSKLGAMNYVLQNAADPNIKAEIQGMYSDLDGVGGWLSATGQVASKAVVGALDAAHDEGITGAELTMLGATIGMGGNAFASRQFARSLERGIAKSRSGMTVDQFMENYAKGLIGRGEVVAQVSNASRIARNYQLLGAAVGGASEIGFFSLKSINENIDRANEEIKEYNRTHMDKKEYLTFVTYDNKIENVIENAGLILGMKVYGGHGIDLPKFKGSVIGERAKLGNSLLKRFGMDLTKREIDDLNELGFGKFKGFDSSMVEALLTDRGNGVNWYTYILNNRLVGFDTMRKLRLAMEDKMVVAGYTVDNDGKIVATMSPTDVVVEAKVVKLPNGRYAIEGYDMNKTNVMTLDYATEKEANEQMKTIDRLIAENESKQLELMFGDRIDIVKDAVNKWAEENGVDPKLAQWTYYDWVTRRENAPMESLEMAAKVRQVVAKEIEANRAEYVAKAKDMIKSRTGYSIDDIRYKDAEDVTDEEIYALNAYTNMLLEMKKDMTTDPRIREIEKTSDVNSGTRKVGVYKGRNVYYIGNLEGGRVTVIDPETGKHESVVAAYVTPVEERPISEEIDAVVETYDPMKGVQDGNVVWTVDGQSGEWYQGKVRKDGDMYVIESDGRQPKTADAETIDALQRQHDEVEMQQAVANEQQNQNQIGEEAGSQQWMDVDGVKKPIRSAEERGDMMHVVYEDGTAEDVTFDDYQARMHDVAAEQEAVMMQAEAQKQQKIAEVGGLNTLEDITNWRNGQNGSIDAEVESELLKREKLIRDNYKIQTLQRIGTSDLDGLDEIESENQKWGDPEISSAIEEKRRAELQKISDASYEEGTQIFTDENIEKEIKNGLDSFDNVISEFESDVEKLYEQQNNTTDRKEIAKLDGAIRAFKDGLKRLKDARDKYVEEEQNLASIEMDEYKKASGEDSIMGNEDLVDLRNQKIMNEEVVGDEGKYSKEVIAKAKGRIRAIGERIQYLEAEEKKMSGSFEGVKKKTLEYIENTANLDELESAWKEAGKTDGMTSDSEVKKIYEAKQRLLTMTEKPEDFQQRMKRGKTSEDQKKMDLLFMEKYSSLKSKAKRGDKLAKEIVDEIERRLAIFANDRTNLTYEELDSMFRAMNTDKERNDLWTKIMSKMKGSHQKFQIVDYLEKNYLGVSDYDGVVKIPVNELIYGTYGTADRGEVILHEMVHAITHEAIEYVYSYEMRRTPKYATWASGLKVTEGMREGARDVIKIFDVVKKNQSVFGLKGEYGMTNPHEMMAELTANVEFRKKMKEANLWTRLVNGVLKMCGVIPKDSEKYTSESAYSKAYAAMEKIIDNWSDPGYYASKQSPEAPGNIKEGSKKTSYTEEALSSLKKAQETKAEEERKNSAVQREIARENWGTETLDLVEKMAIALGLRMKYVDKVAGGLANAQILDGEIQIESSNGEPIKFLMGHEVMHHIKRVSPDLYHAYMNQMRNLVGAKAFDREVDRLRELYNKKHVKISEDRLKEEVVADHSGDVVSNTDTFERFINSLVSAGKPVMIERLMDVVRKIDDFLLGVGGKYGGMNAGNLAEQVRTKATRDRMSEIYTKGLKAAREAWMNNAVVKMKSSEDVQPELAQELADKGLVQEGGVVMGQEAQELKEATGYKTPMEIDDVQYSLKTKGDWMLSYLGNNPDERMLAIANAVDRWYERAATDDIISEYMSTSEYPDGDLNRDGTGPLRGNVEYKYTFDLDTTCPRTYQYLNLADQIEQRLGRPLTQREAILLIEEMRGMGQMIPCTYCYAENKRQALKNYFNNFIEYRRNVMAAKDDAGALAAMYGHTDNDPAKPIGKAAKEVLNRWRDKRNMLSNYNPTIQELVDGYNVARSMAMNLLDKMDADPESPFDVNMSDQKAVNMLAKELGWKHEKGAPFEDANAVATLKNFINEWRYDKLENIQHPRMVEVPEHLGGLGDPRVKMNMALWNEMLRYGASASSAHNSVRYYPYTNELEGIKAEDREYINNMGGLRMHSTNDFRLDYAGDYFQLIADMDKGGWFGHTYTKSPDFVRIFGNTGYRINMSLAAYDGPNGEVQMNSEEGFDWNVAQQLRKIYKNAGAMMMTTSARQLQFALDSDWIDMIIPFHSSGLPKEVMNMRGWEDAQSTQNEKYFSTNYKIYLLNKEHSADLEKIGVKFTKSTKAATVNEIFNKFYKTVKPLVKWEKKDGVWKKKKVAPHFLPHGTQVEVATDVEGVNEKISLEGWHRKGESQEADLQRYFDLCRRYGVMPRFFGLTLEDGSQVIEHKNYLKLIKETARMDTEQEAVKFNLHEPNQGYIDELGNIGGVDPSTCENAFYDEATGIWVAKDPKTGAVSKLDYSTGKAWTPMAFAMNEMRRQSKKNGGSGVTREEQTSDQYNIVENFWDKVIKHEWNVEEVKDKNGRKKYKVTNATGKQRPLDYLSPEARQFWNLFVRAANSAKNTDEQARRAAVPYHPEVEDADAQYSMKVETKKKAEDRFKEDMPGIKFSAEEIHAAFPNWINFAYVEQPIEYYRYDEETDTNVKISKEEYQNIDDAFEVQNDPVTRIYGRDAVTLMSEVRKSDAPTYNKMRQQFERNGYIDFADPDSERPVPGSFDIGYLYGSDYSIENVEDSALLMEDRGYSKDDLRRMIAVQNIADMRNDKANGEPVYSLKDDTAKGQKAFEESGEHKHTLEEYFDKDPEVLVSTEFGGAETGDVSARVYAPSAYSWLKKLADKGYDGKLITESVKSLRENGYIDVYETYDGDDVDWDLVDELVSEGKMPAEFYTSADFDGMKFFNGEKMSKEIDESTPEDQKMSKARGAIAAMQLERWARSVEKDADVGESAQFSLKAEKFEDEMKKVGEDAWKQDFGSGGTSINSSKLPSGFALVDKVGGWSNPGDVVLDMGGGRFDNAVEMLKEKGIELLVFDPYNRDTNHNSMVAGRMKDEGADKTICNNCLNVINTAGARANVILQCAKALKPGGTSYFTIYEGNGTGVGKVSKNDCWQENRKTADYLDEIRKYYNDVTIKGKLIIAKDPKQTEELSYWNFNGYTDEGGVSFSLKKEKAEGAKNVDLIWKEGEDNSGPARAFQVTWPSTGKKNTEERDRKYGVGKRMGGVYFHKDYAADVVPQDVLEKALKIVPEDFKYNCMYYDEKNPTQLRFDEAPDFDSAREPIPGDMILVDTATGKVVPDSRGNEVRHSDMIWHHKWQWVKDEYKGFDVQESFDWSVKWKDAFDAQPTGIGSMRVWNEKLASVGLPADNKIRKGESYADYSKRMLSLKAGKGPDDDGPDGPATPGGGGRPKVRHERTGWTERNYGVPYQGSKNQIADELIYVLPKGKRFVDLFSGGGAMSHAMALSGNVESVHMNDKAPFGQQLFLDAMEGKYHDYDRRVTREEFEGMRYTSEGLMHSYNGNGRSYAADSKDRSKANEQIARVKALEKMKDKRGMFTSSDLDYRDVELKDGDVIYADIPYENTGNTSYSKAGKFDMKAFTDWAAGLDKPVYVSSFEAPEGFAEVWNSGEKRGFRAGTRKVERLFVQDRFADAERKRIAEAMKQSTDNVQYSLNDDSELEREHRIRKDWSYDATAEMEVSDFKRKTSALLKEMGGKEVTEKNMFDTIYKVGGYYNNSKSNVLSLLRKMATHDLNGIRRHVSSAMDGNGEVISRLDPDDLIGYQQIGGTEDDPKLMELRAIDLYKAQEKMLAPVLERYIGVMKNMKGDPNGQKYIDIKIDAAEKELKKIRDLANGVVDAQYSLKDPLKDNPWTARKKQRGEGWKQINEMHNFIDSFWNWGRYADADDVKDSVKKLTTFVRGQLTKELGTRIGSARIKTLLSNINKATQKQDLNGPVRTIQRMLNDAEIELEVQDMMKLLSIQLQKKNTSGNVVPKWVDDNTRKIYDAVRETYGKMLQTSKDAEIAQKSKDIAEVHKELLQKLRDHGIDPNSWNGTDYKGNNWDALSDADKDELRNLRNAYGSLENDRQILKQEREDLLLGQNLTETEKALAQLRSDLEQREADSQIDPTVKWTDADKDMLYVVMPMRERLLSMRERYAELRDLKENWKAELDALDNIAHGAGYQSRRGQQKRVVWAAEDAYIQKQKEIAAATREINDAMANILGQGAERLKDWKEQQALHKAHMIRMGLDDFGRKRPLMKGERSHRRKLKDMLTKIVDLWDSPLHSLHFLLSNDQNHLGGEGRLYKYFFSDPETSVVTAWDNKRKATEENGAALDAKIAELWKGKMDRMTKGQRMKRSLWDGLKRIDNLNALYGDMQTDLEVPIRRNLSEDEAVTNNQHNYEGRSDWTTTDTFDEEMTKGHALYLWLTWRQPDGRMKMTKMGYTDDSMTEIERALGPEYMQFGEWLTEEFLPKLRETKYNPRYTEIFGSSMANNPHYFPIRVDKEQVRPKAGIEDVQTQFMPSLGAPNLISRVSNTTPIDAQADALDVLKSYLENMEQWHAMAPILQDFNAMHASKTLKRAMEASHKGSFSTLMEAAQVATGSMYERQDSKAAEMFKKVFNRIVAAGARGHIAFRAMTAVKQLFSYDAFRAYSADPLFQWHLTQNICTPPSSIKWAMKNLPAFRERVSKGDMGLEGMEDYDDMSAFVKKYGEAGMWMNKLFDKWAVAAGAKAVYDLASKRKRAELELSNAIGDTAYTQDEIRQLAHDWAVNEAEIIYNQSQQSSRNEFSSAMQKSSSTLVRPFMLFQNANIGYRRQTITNLYNLYKLATRDVKDEDGYSLSTKKKIKASFGSAFGYLMFGAYLHGLWNLAGNTNNLYNAFSGDMTDDEKEKYLQSVLLGTLSNGSTFGAPISSWTSGYEWEPFEVFKDVKKILEIAKKENPKEGEMERKLFESIAMYTGGVNLETWRNICEGARGLVLESKVAPEKALDFMVMFNMNKTDRKGWAKALLRKYGPTEFAAGYKAAEKSNAQSDRTNEMANAWMQRYDQEFFDEMEGIRKMQKQMNDIREEAKKAAMVKGADAEAIYEEASKKIEEISSSKEFARWKPFIAGGHYHVYELLMKSVRANIRYENPEGAPANENTQKISDKDLIKELDKVIAKQRDLIK